MRAAASLHAVPSRADHAPPSPVVLVDGTPEPRLTMISYQAESPLDTRSIVLDAGQPSSYATLRRHWQQAHVVVAQPWRLVDGQVRWTVLGQGRLRQSEQDTVSGRANRRLTLSDAWSTELDKGVKQIWWVRGDRALVAEAAGRLLPGESGNRSQERHRFNGHDVHVLEADGGAWTVGEALAAVSAWASLELSLTLLPREITRAPLIQSVDLAASVGEVLRRLLEPYRLVVQREILREGEAIIERRSVRPMTHGRMLRLPSPRADEPVGRLVSLSGHEAAVAAEPWVARGEGWRVESTFDLVPGWHPDLEGAADAEYGRTTSSDFARYANAYRYWVLNEDGRFSGPPFERGPAFDLAGFFEDDRLRPQALPFRNCLTLNDAGEPKPPLVQVSTDGGNTWLQYPGQVRMAEHRAAIYLTDDVLPSSFLTTAKTGEARVRVTASLQSPQPVEVMRWRGNPFVGTHSPRVFDLSAAFLFERVAEASIHHDAIKAGELQARQSDSSMAMRQWLVDRMRGESRQRSLGSSRARLILSGMWPGLQPGDRLLRPREVAGRAASATHPPLAITRVRCRWDSSVTELDVLM